MSAALINKTVWLPLNIDLGRSHWEENEITVALYLFDIKVPYI